MPSQKIPIISARRRPVDASQTNPSQSMSDLTLGRPGSQFKNMDAFPCFATAENSNIQPKMGLQRRNLHQAQWQPGRALIQR